MDESEIFRRNLVAAMEEQNLRAATVSKRAKMNARAVTDIMEGRSQSPKLSTIFRLCEAVGRDPGEMLGLGKRPKIQSDLAEFLAQYDEADQAQFLSALRAFRGGRQ